MKAEASVTSQTDQLTCIAWACQGTRALPVGQVCSFLSSGEHSAPGRGQQVPLGVPGPRDMPRGLSSCREEPQLGRSVWETAPPAALLAVNLEAQGSVKGYMVPQDEKGFEPPFTYWVTKKSSGIM